MCVQSLNLLTEFNFLSPDNNIYITKEFKSGCFPRGIQNEYKYFITHDTYRSGKLTLV